MRIIKFTKKINFSITIFLIFLFANSPTSSFISSNVGQFAFYGNYSDDKLGRNVCIVGDVNNDGFDDYAITAPDNDEGGINAGIVYLFFGEENIEMEDLTLADADVKFIGSEVGGKTGTSITGNFDFNGDGYDDFLISSPFSNYKATYSGKVSIVYGIITSAWNKEIHISALPYFYGEKAGSLLGTQFSSKNSLSALGDIDGDGFDDIAMTSADYSNNEIIDNGKFYIYYGKSAKMTGAHNTSDADLKIIGENKYDRFTSIAKVGDLDGNGYSDLVMGALAVDTSEIINIGAVYIKYLDGSRLTGQYNISNFYDKIIYGSEVNSQFGYCIIDTGDFDGDGNADFAVSAPLQDVGTYRDVGSVFIFNDKNLEVESTVLDASITINGEENNNIFGRDMSLVEDFNQDGTKNIAVSAFRASIATSPYEDGIVYLIESGLNKSEIFVANSKNKISNPYSEERLGYILSSGGDINGDGKIDLIIGAPYADSINGSISNVGKAYVLTEYYPERLHTVTKTVTIAGSDNSTVEEKGFFGSLPISPIPLFLSLVTVAVIFKKKGKWHI